MAVADKEIALWILTAFKTEWEREPSPEKCRTESELLEPLKTQHGINDSDLARGRAFLDERGLIQSAERNERRASLPSREGLGYLEAEAILAKQKGFWQTDAGLVMCGIILTYIAASIIKYLPK